MTTSINSMASMMQNFMQTQQQQQAYMYNAMQNWNQASLYQGYGAGMTQPTGVTTSQSQGTELSSSQVQDVRSQAVDIRTLPRDSVVPQA